MPYMRIWWRLGLGAEHRWQISTLHSNLDKTPLVERVGSKLRYAGPRQAVTKYQPCLDANS